ncbi:Protein aardvark [Porphyridium purpureum]|uniref:Protein aardvark n=1 Tax=Porphyridium purpureum TaxID=35688 RepID=A0A5J4YWA5_PORPP|nr:Protein aardvark [Porphyridium purpureum]|eukprot:POR1374..scf227_4
MEQCEAAVNGAQKAMVDAAIEAVAMDELCRLSHEPAMRQPLVDAGAIGCLATALQSHAMVPPVQKRGLEIAANLAQLDTPTKVKLVDAGIIALVANAMSSNLQDQALQAVGTLLLSLLAALKKKDVCIKIVQDGGIESLCRAMDTYTGNSSIQSQGCDVLFLVTSALDDKAVQDRVRSARGIPVIIQDIAAYEQSPGFLQIAIQILASLARKNTANQEEISELNGIEVILNAMRNQMTHEGVLLAGCQALRFLGFSRENRTRIGDADGVEMVVTAIKQLQTNPAALLVVLKSLNNVTFDNLQNKSAAGRCGAIQLTVEIMDLNRNSGELQEDGCRLLRNLAEGVELNQRIMVDVGGLSSVLFAMTTHPNYLGICEHSCAALLVLAKNDMLLSNVNVADVRRLVESRLEMHRENIEFQRYAKELLELLDDNAASIQRNRTRSRSMSRSRSKSRGSNAGSDGGFQSSAMRNRTRSRSQRSNSKGRGKETKSSPGGGFLSKVAVELRSPCLAPSFLRSCATLRFSSFIN